MLKALVQGRLRLVCSVLSRRATNGLMTSASAIRPSQTRKEVRWETDVKSAVSLTLAFGQS